MNRLKELSEALQSGNVDEVKNNINMALDEGISAGEVLREGLLAGMNIIGEKFKKDEIFVPEVLISARAMNAGTELLKPILIEDGEKAIGKALIGTVKDDLHDIGKNLVIMMLEGAGFEVVDLGMDVSQNDFINAVKKEKPDVLGMSSLLTTTMPYMEDVIKALEEANLREGLYVMVGGAPVSNHFAKEIGADAYAKDAATAASFAKESVVGKNQ
ncbi:MAG: corrinoid protein [bacterium]